MIGDSLPICLPPGSRFNSCVPVWRLGGSAVILWLAGPARQKVAASLEYYCSRRVTRLSVAIGAGLYGGLRLRRSLVGVRNAFPFFRTFQELTTS